jgi:hypothetical protein
MKVWLLALIAIPWAAYLLRIGSSAWRLGALTRLSSRWYR